MSEVKIVLRTINSTSFLFSWPASLPLSLKIFCLHGWWASSSYLAWRALWITVNLGNIYTWFMLPSGIAIAPCNQIWRKSQWKKLLWFISWNWKPPRIPPPALGRFWCLSEKEKHLCCPSRWNLSATASSCWNWPCCWRHRLGRLLRLLCRSYWWLTCRHPDHTTVGINILYPIFAAGWADRRWWLFLSWSQPRLWPRINLWRCRGCTFWWE